MTDDLSAAREAWERIAQAADSGGRPWDWRGGMMAEGSERTYAGYPQTVMIVGTGTIIATTYDEQEDEPPPLATFISTFDPPTVLSILATLAQRDEMLARLTERVAQLEADSKPWRDPV